MNLHFPGYETSEEFWVVSGLMIAIILALVGFFRYKRWW
jgi:Mg2+ and Co2+ transporter CorA